VLFRSQQALRDEAGAIFVVSDATLRWLAPARLDDLLRITVAPTALGRASLTVAQQAWCGERLLCEATVRIGCVDAGTFRPRRLPTTITDSPEWQRP
jgi:acyl-CoA thioester hydrolase